MQSEWVKQRSTSLYTDPFLLEEKIYTDSNHSSKLHYDGGSPEDKTKQIELIHAFVSKLMEGIVPEPRFDLSKFHRTAKPNAVAS